MPQEGYLLEWLWKIVKALIFLVMAYDWIVLLSYGCIPLDCCGFDYSIRTFEKDMQI